MVIFFLSFYFHVALVPSVTPVAMRNLNTKDGVLPPDPLWITFEDTDGDSRRWPTNTTPVPDAEGHVNYMQPLAIDHPNAIKWRLICGASIAEMLNYPDYREFFLFFSVLRTFGTEDPSETKKYVLKSWPAGYQMYDHNKGPLANPRHDLYLVGTRFNKLLYFYRALTTVCTCTRLRTGSAISLPT